MIALGRLVLAANWNDVLYPDIDHVNHMNTTNTALAEKLRAGKHREDTGRYITSITSSDGWSLIINDVIFEEFRDYYQLL